MTILASAMDEPVGRSEQDGSSGSPSSSLRLAWTVAGVAALVAVVAVALLVFLQLRKPNGPDDALHAYYSAVARGDCDASHALLSGGLRGQIPEDAWCRYVAGQSGRFPAGFTVVRFTFEARTRTTAMTVEEVGTGAQAGPVTWGLAKGPTDEWLVARFPPGREPSL
jgi:hypothetical protein